MEFMVQFLCLKLAKDEFVTIQTRKLLLALLLSQITSTTAMLLSLLVFKSYWLLSTMTSSRFGTPTRRLKFFSFKWFLEDSLFSKLGLFFFKHAYQKKSHQPHIYQINLKDYIDTKNDLYDWNFFQFQKQFFIFNFYFINQIDLSLHVWRHYW